MECRIIKKENRAEVSRMEQFIKHHEKSHFLQTPAWAEVKECWDWRGILAVEEEKVLGAMSVLIRPLPFGVSLMYVPRGPVCDRSDPCTMSCLLGGADTLATELHALEILTDPDEPWENDRFRELMKAWGFREHEDDGFGNIQAQHVFRLPLQGETEESVFCGFCQKTRYNIRLAQRKGVRVHSFSGEESVPEAVWEAFFALMEETGQRDHFIPRKKEYYQKVLEHLGAEAVLYLAYLEDTPIAGTIGVFSGGKGWYLYGASANAHRNCMPNYLLQWEMVRTAMARGCVFYDFRGVPGNVGTEHPLYGLYRFKKGFGGTYTKFSGLYVRRCRRLSACLFEWGLRCFRKLRGWWCCDRE